MTEIASKKCLALPAYPNHHLWTWCASWHAWNDTNFVSMWACMAGLHAKVEWIRTPNAPCVTFGLCFWVFHRTNPRKYIKCHNSMEFIMGALHGDASVWEKIWIHFIDVKKKCIQTRPTGYPNHHHWTWCASCHACNDTKICQHVGMLIEGLHAKFEGIRTPNIRCVMFGQVFWGF